MAQIFFLTLKKKIFICTIYGYKKGKKLYFIFMPPLFVVGPEITTLQLVKVQEKKKTLEDNGTNLSCFPGSSLCQKYHGLVF